MSLWIAGVSLVDTRPVLTFWTMVGYLQLPLATCNHPTPREPENGDHSGLATGDSDHNDNSDARALYCSTNLAASYLPAR